MNVAKPQCRTAAAIARAEDTLAEAANPLPPGPWDYDMRKAFEHLARSRHSLQAAALANSKDKAARSE